MKSTALRERAMDTVVAQMKKDAFARELGIELLELEPGRAKVRMQVGPEHRNSVGMVHGGVVFSLADYAFAAACNSHGTVAVAINVNVSFLRPAKGKVLEAEALEVSKSRSLGTYDVTVKDGEGRLVSVFRGMAFRTGEAFGEAGED
jgi:acyl-CoA thioesterase